MQDNIKLSGRVGLSLGLRYDSFGAFTNTGVEDAVLMPGAGSNIESRIASATIAYEGGGSSSAYRADRNNWSGRMGISYNLKENGRTVLRAGFGIYYYRPFAALFQNVVYNNVDYRYAFIPNGPLGSQGYLRRIS